nr:hypothetical protein [Tanacetum cinerariifolium]
MGGFTDLTGIEFLVGGICTVINPDYDLQNTFVPQWNVTNSFRLDDGGVCHEMVDEDEEIDNLKARMLLKEAEAAEAIRLRAEASNFKAVEKSFWDEVNTLNGRQPLAKLLRKVCKMGPSAEMDYVSALQQLQSVNFPLLTELKSNKDVSIEALMNILRLEEHLGERLRLNESQPHADQLMVPINHSPDKTVVGASTISLALDVFDARVRRIRENITSHRSFLHGVFIPTGTEGTSDTAPGTTIALSTTFVFARSIPPISTDDYEVVRLDGQEGAGAKSQAIAAGNVDPFANVDDVDLNVLHIEALMNILRLKEHLGERLRLNESQPHADQLMVPIYHSPDKTVVGASSISLALDVSDARVRRIRENITSHRSFLHGVFIPTGTEGTFDTAPGTTIALSTTFVFARSIPPISTDD